MSSSELTGSPPLGPAATFDWFERMRTLGERKARGVGLTTVLTLAVLLHLAVGGVSLFSLGDMRRFAELVQSMTKSRLGLAYEVQVDELPPPPEPEAQPEPEPEPEPVPEQAPPPVPLPPTEAAPNTPTEEAPPPAAAEAGAILSAPDDAPLDLTDQGFVSGTGTRFAGKQTAATGTSKKAVSDMRASGRGVAGGTGSTPGAPIASKARPAGLGVGANWNSCPFPSEADAEQINQAVVRLVVVVGPTGRPQSVNVVEDPGYGFGRQAKRCAMEKTYEPAADASGNPISGTTPPFRVRFQR